MVEGTVSKPKRRNSNNNSKTSGNKQSGNKQIGNKPPMNNQNGNQVPQGPQGPEGSRPADQENMLNLQELKEISIQNLNKIAKTMEIEGSARNAETGIDFQDPESPDGKVWPRIFRRCPGNAA